MTPTPRIQTVRGALARLLRSARTGILLASYFTAMVSAQANTALADQPLFTNTAVPGNLVLALSVEFPTVVSMAHVGAFAPATNHLGYFDPSKCYRYYSGTESGTDLSHFYPVSTATDRKCTATGFTDAWSGNFLNWLTMQAIDPFRSALTGGLRVVDTPTTTILERAWATSEANNGGEANFPVVGSGSRTSPSATDIVDHTPLPSTWNAFKASVRTRGNLVWFSNGTLSTGTGGTPTAYVQGATLDLTTVYAFYARVKVCDAGTGYSRETNCRQYSQGWKPEGLLQQYAEKIRFSAFGYLNDPTDNNRDGGVLRAQQKFVGPKIINPGSAATTNSRTEWNSVTGVLELNPDATDAANTASVFGVTVNNSGVINYLNKFGQEKKTFKRRDPVSELYYGALRYLKNQGNVSAWSNVVGDSQKDRLIDGFPVITTWDDPIQYSCQRNFVLGIGDTNTNWDFNLPGSTAGSNEPSRPSEVSGDTTVNAKTLTDMVGSLQSMGASLGTTGISNGSYLMAGLAYDANIRDIRPDDATKPQTIGKQTVQTYWLDVLEFGNYANNNQFYLASKYGGFKVPDGYTAGSALTDSWWRTTTDTTPNGQPRPDNYYTAARPDQMVDGLTKAFASIAAALRAYTTSFSTALPQVSVAGNASFAAQFDSDNWTGEVAASELSFDATTGAPSQSARWSFAAKLATQLSGTGWDTNRRVISRNTSTGQGVPFRAAADLDQLAKLDSSYRTGDDSAAFLNYLRGDRQHEQNSTTTGSYKAYRTRAGLLADVVSSKARPVGPPSLPLSNSSNPGYGSFKTTWAARPTIVYLGSNGGMLHAINGALTGTDAGKEMFAFVPSALFDGPSSTPATNGLVALGNPTFEHRYYVNATPGVFDIDFGRVSGGNGTADWRTVLIGGLGKGGRSYYALDVTDPAGMITGTDIAAQEANAAGKVLWEFSHVDLGYTYGEPAVVKSKRHGGKWVVLLPSGYNNSSGQGFIFVLNPKTGELIEKVRVDTDTASGDGLAHLNAFVLDRTDGVADAIYAGDLAGNVWRAELNTVLTTVDGDKVDSSYEAVAIAKLTNSSSQEQPVTTRPLIEVDPRTGRRFVLVGTGLMLDNTHIGSTVQQSFYAIVDGRNTRFGNASDLPSGITFPIRRGNLADNTNLLDDIAYNTTTQIGWYIEMGTGAGSLGWRVISDPSSAFGIVTFASTLPSGDVCKPTGSSRIYAVSLGTGKSVLTSGVDYINYSTALTGVVTDLRFFTVNGVPRLIAGSDSGELKAPPGTFGNAGTIRRLNWRELPVAN
ncbi:MAG: pilus assembly protein [Betaproteobacteria bacterium]|nr:pilus assembly protein [Betaproteobacteria bacterium]